MRYAVQSLLIILTAALFFTACEKEEDVSNLYEINYADSENWLAKPESTNKAVDIFYVYPSVWRKANSEDANIADINAPEMRAGATVVFSQQATAFETIGNIYAPFYRQAVAGYALSLSPTKRDLFIAGNPVADAQINLQRGVVCCSSVNAKNLHKTNLILPEGVYHVYDFGFYYYNLRANAENRVRDY